MKKTRDESWRRRAAWLTSSSESSWLSSHCRLTAILNPQFALFHIIISKQSREGCQECEGRADVWLSKIFINCAYAAWTVINCQRHHSERRCHCRRHRHRCCICRQDNKSCNRLDTETPHKPAKGSSGDPYMIYNHAAAARFPRFSTLP